MILSAFGLLVSCVLISLVALDLARQLAPLTIADETVARLKRCARSGDTMA